MANLRAGTLVEIQGLPGPAQPVTDASGIQAVDLNGQKAQLVSYDRDAGRWIAATFNGSMITVDPKYIRQLAGEELSGYDFVFGPKSDFDTVGAELADVLATKGYAVMKLFVADEDASDMVACAKRLEAEDQFSRLAVEFESGYLGKESTAKTLLLDPSSSEAPAHVADSPLATMDQNFGAICQMLGPHSEESLGFEIYSRTGLLLRMPLEESDEDRYPPAELDDGDAESYMHTMCRKKLTLLQFVGPTSGTITLSLPGDGEGGDIELQAEPHTVIIMVNSRYAYEYDPTGENLALATFMLSPPPVYTLDQIEGDVSALGMMGTGPPPPPGEQITIGGMYCRYGSGSEGREQLWASVGNAATDGLVEVPFLRWDHGPYWDPESVRGGAYTKHGSFGIEAVEMFDNKFFEISPGEARSMDPCQRQVMEVSYIALMEGGWDKRSLQRAPANIGHFVGIDKDDWLCMSTAGMIDLSGATGAAAAANAITSNRFSYSMNLKGASMTIDTACSSSLVCTHVSKLHLRYKDNEIMPASVVNGLNLMLFPGPFVGCCAAGMLSHEGRCFTFNSTADGYARGELCGALLFKAKQFNPDDGGLCCLAGSQTNQDGRSASLTAPNGPAQEKCIAAVLKEVGLTPTEVDCIECHGTGTSLGGPIEVGSFKKVMSVTPRVEPLVTGAHKSNMAHGEGGAGLCGFFKCCTMVMHCQAAANCHLKTKNPHLDIDGFPCQILSEVVVMREDSAYAGVSSFGFGGTNAHGEAWGRNIMTSRGAAQQDPQTAFQKRLALAPPAEITMIGGDVMEWETTGLDPRGDPSTRWTVFIDDDGVAEWEKEEEDAVDYGDEFFIQGTSNNWQPEALEQHESIPGCWEGTITIGSSGEEEFQIVADGENQKERVYSPSQPGCTLKAAIINFGAAGREMSWLIRGNPGETYKVEFFQQDKHRSIMWLKQ
uniref:Type I polyketide synthase n=1 Tax=Kryptoperidinium triquetrum TaxID=66468 RepID=K7W9M8_KRYTR|nr:type I polyketide synthase [Heterocapsa triquetra]